MSLTGFGLAVYDGSKKHPVRRLRRYKTEPLKESDGLKLRPRGQLAQDRFVGDEEERIEWLRQRVALAVAKYGICFVVIESKNFMAKGAAKKIDELQGVVKNWLHVNEVAFVLLTPGQLKKALTGDGSASKTEMIFAAKKIDKRVCDDDRADAVAAAKAGWDQWDDLVDD